MDTTLKIGGVAVGAFLTLLAAGFAHDTLFQQHMTIAFLDSGFYAHPDLERRIAEARAA